MNADILINGFEMFKDAEVSEMNVLVVSFKTKVPVTSVMANFLAKRKAGMVFNEKYTFVCLPMKDVEIVFK